MRSWQKNDVRNVRVEVTPGTPFFSWTRWDGPEQIAAAQRIERDIRRHVDHFDTVSVMYDRVVCCRFCGDTSEYPPDELPCCCNEALAAEEDYWRKRAEGE